MIRVLQYLSVAARNDKPQGSQQFNQGSVYTLLIFEMTLSLSEVVNAFIHNVLGENIIDICVASPGFNQRLEFDINAFCSA